MLFSTCEYLEICSIITLLFCGYKNKFFFFAFQWHYFQSKWQSHCSTILFIQYYPGLAGAISRCSVNSSAMYSLSVTASQQPSPVSCSCQLQAQYILGHCKLNTSHLSLRCSLLPSVVKFSPSSLSQPCCPPSECTILLFFKVATFLIWILPFFKFH